MFIVYITQILDLYANEAKHSKVLWSQKGVQVYLKKRSAVTILMDIFPTALSKSIYDYDTEIYVEERKIQNFLEYSCTHFK